MNPGIYCLLVLLLFLLQSGANAIYYAARHGHVETLKFLHGKMCPLDIQDKVEDDSLPPLHTGPTLSTHSPSLLTQHCHWRSALFDFH